MTELIKEIDTVRVNGTERSEVKEQVVVESHLTLFVNDKEISSFIYSSGMERQLVVGFLLSSGLISDLSQIESIELKNGACYLMTVDGAKMREQMEEHLQMNHDSLLTVRKTLTDNQKNHYATRGFHGAIIWEIPTGKWFVREDVGRHNAVDTVIGYGVENGFELSKSLVLLSGRLVSNIVSKCVNSKIPMIASMTVATDLGIEMAHKANMTIVGSLSEDGFWLYHEGAVKVT